MRWDSLSADIAARFSQERREEVGFEAQERAVAEAGALTVLDRLRPGTGHIVSCRLRNGTSLAGTISARGSDWVEIGAASGRHLVPVAAIEAVQGVRLVGTLPRGEIERQLSLSSPLRRVAATGRTVLVTTDGGVLTGRLVAVGRDHVVLDASDDCGLMIRYAAIVWLRVPS